MSEAFEKAWTAYTWKWKLQLVGFATLPTPKDNFTAGWKTCEAHLRDLAQAKCAEMYSILTRVATCDPTLKGEEILASLKDNSGWEQGVEAGWQAC